jgi:rhodanese-related sulfurtransferase
MTIPSATPADVTDATWLLDVREDDEWAAGHVVGAVHIPMSALLPRVGEVPKEGDVVVMCKVGGRSAQVAAYLMQQGWTNVRNLDGGAVSWVGAGRDLVSENGAPPTVL